MGFLWPNKHHFIATNNRLYLRHEFKTFCVGVSCSLTVGRHNYFFVFEESFYLWTTHSNLEWRQMTSTSKRRLIVKSRYAKISIGILAVAIGTFLSQAVCADEIDR